MPNLKRPVYDSKKKQTETIVSMFYNVEYENNLKNIGQDVLSYWLFTSPGNEQ